MEVDREWSLRGEAVAWVDEEWPGWVRVRLDDADGRAWYVVDKVPVFGLDLALGAPLPVPVRLLCDVVGEDGDLVVIMLRWNVDTRQFRVRRDQLA